MAKIPCLFLAFVIIGVQAFTQTEKGSSFSGPGFNVSYTYSSTPNSAGDITSHSQSGYTSLYFQVGHFVLDNLAIGPGVSTAYSWYKNTSGGYYNKSQIGTISLSPFIRYYIGKNQKVKIFIQSSGGIDYEIDYYEYSYAQNGENTVIKDHFHTLNFNAGAAFGVEYFINHLLGIRCQLAYQFDHYVYSSDGSDHDTKTNSHSVNFGVGLNYYFTKSKKSDKE
jgi:hypothetical protein